MDMREEEKKLTLEEARAVINEQDAIILKAFETRMGAVREVLRNKIEQGLPVYVPQREAEILQKAAAEVPKELSEYTVELYKKLMEVSRAYQNRLRRFGLLGRKLSHSFSPEIHRQLAQYSEPYSYDIFEVEPENLESFVRCGDWAGLNVTIPYKQDVMAFCDELSPEAERIGAVNTLVRRDGRILGYNTDYTGFRKTVEASGAPVCGAKCIVLGSGGASRAVTCVLEDLGASQVVVVSRDGRTGCDYLQMKQDHQDAVIMVNTTPVGMYPHTGVSAAYPGAFWKLEYVFDVIYNPLRTNFLCQARKSGMETFNGLKMLTEQAKASAQLFLNCEIPESAAASIERSLAWEKENIVLIGMPGCGKSTVGRILAEKTGRRFVDIDERITEREGRSIPSIFAEDGEEQFRRMETEAVESLKQETGIVIACGGGVVTREENYYSLAENGRLIFLNRDISLLPTDGRPLSQSTPLARMYAHRLPLYRSWCDMEVENSGKTPEETAAEIEAYILPSRPEYDKI